MTVYGFADRSTAERLSAMVSGVGIADVPADLFRDVPLIIVRSPDDGIEAMDNPDDDDDDAELPSELCDAWSIVETGGKVYRRRLVDPDGDPIQIRCANMAGEEIEGGRFGRASQCIGGAYLVDWFPC